MAREPEVTDVGVRAVGAEQDVARLDVAVDEPGVMCGVQGTGHLPDEVDRPFRFEAAFATQQVAQVFALDVLHREEEAAVVVAGGDRGDDVRVVEARSDLTLAQEPLPEALVVCELAVEQLERDDVAVLVDGAVDLAHRTLTDQRFDSKAGDRHAAPIPARSGTCSRRRCSRQGANRL